MSKEDIGNIYKETLRGLEVDTDSRVFMTMQRFLPKDKSAYILDAACGYGRYCMALKEMGYENIYAVDLFENIPIPGVIYVKGSMDELPKEWEGMFDFILCQSAIYHLDEPSEGLREFSRCLKVGGKILFTAHTKYSLWTCWFKMKLLLGVDSIQNLNNVHFDRDINEYLSMCKKCGLELLYLDGIQFSMFYNYFYKRVARRLARDFSVRIPVISSHFEFSEFIRRLRAKFGYHSLIVAQKNEEHK